MTDASPEMLAAWAGLEPEIRADFGLFERMAAAAAAAVAPHFRAPTLITENKDADGGFDPVTAGDRAIERAIRDILAAERPDDAILGEEFGETSGAGGVGPGARRRWVIDPIDGTRAFIAGLPLWGVLVGVETDGRASHGLMAQPHIGERFVGRRDGPGKGAWLTLRDGPTRPIACRPCARLADATFITTDPYLFTDPGERAGFEALRAATRLTRFGTDCYAYALVAAGLVDLVVESGLAPYDIGALIPIVEGAGGVVTTWDGGAPEAGGRILIAGDPRLHEAAQAILLREAG